MIKINNYEKALIELSEIVKRFDESIKNKIPNDFYEIIDYSKKSDYKFVYKENVPLFEQELLPETKAILSILYSDYLCSKEEKEKWDKYDNFEQKIIKRKNEEIVNKKDSIKNNSNNIVLEKNVPKLEVIKYEKPKWYKKIVTFFKEKILKKFRK